MLFYGANAFLHFSFMEDERAIGMIGIAMMNTLYRVAAIIVLLPFIKYLERVTDRLLKHMPEPEKQHRIYEVEDLEERFLENPVLALTQSKEAMWKMADITEENLFLSFDLIGKYDAETAEKVIAAEDTVDHYEDKLGTYLVKVTGQTLNHAETLECSLYLHTVADFERISDHSVNIQEAALEIFEKKVRFSDGAVDELRVLENALRKIVTITFRAFREGDLELAAHVEPLEELIDVQSNRYVMAVEQADVSVGLGVDIQS